MKPAAPQRFRHRLSELATRLPWWGGLLSALTAYALLHPIAVLQMPSPTGTLDVVTSALARLLILLAGVGQYLLPLNFLVAATISGFERWRRDELRDSVRQDTSGSILRGLPRRDFELLVGDAFRRQGYEVRIPQTDSGVQDRVIELTRDGRRFLVDCTDWRSWKAGADAVRGLHERMKETHSAGGFAVTSGLFTPEARHFAADADIQLIDGRHLKELVRAEDEPTKGDLSSMRGQLRDILSRWRVLVPNLRRRSNPAPPTLEPGITTSPGRLPDAEDRAISTTAVEEIVAANDPVTAAGQELAALIRAERRIEGEIELSAPPVQTRDANRPRLRVALPRFRARSIADAAGMLLTAGILWGIYDWFLALPDDPTSTPWALLGAGSNSDDLIRRLQGLSRTQTVARILEGKRPLGQYQFGPPQGYLTQAPQQIPIQEEPVEVYHSLRELETAFEAKYVPPPECYAYESSNQMVKCGNHRIRARRTFIENGGKVTPILLGSWEEPRQVPTETSPQYWRRYDGDEWRQGSSGGWEQDWQPDTVQERAQDWAQGPEPQSDQDWQREQRQQPTQDWRQDQSQGTAEGWSSDWRSEPAPIEGRHWVDDL